MSGWVVVDVFKMGFAAAGCVDGGGTEVVAGAGAGAIWAVGCANRFSRDPGGDGPGDVVSIAWSLG